MFLVGISIIAFSNVKLELSIIEHRSSSLKLSSGSNLNFDDSFTLLYIA